METTHVDKRRLSMQALIPVLSLAVLWPVDVCLAQVAAPNAAGVAMGQLHLKVTDVEANEKFWNHTRRHRPSRWMDLTA